ncbi:MAG: hypothetical protein KAS64_10145 [Spirochaetes bacterium]|nr:hypothetical protein [Spirochaetota bacterium]
MYKFKTTIYILLLFLVSQLVYSSSDDFGFKPLRRKLRYVEEFYNLYTMNHMPGTGSIERNLVYLQYALNSPYIHPIQALCIIKTRQQHQKYKLLLRTRIAFLLAKGFVQLGYQYDKEDIYFFNMEFAKDLKDSFRIAEHYYKEAIAYWKEAKRVAAKSLLLKDARVKGALIDSIKNEAKKIHYGMINYAKIINFRLKDLERKNKKIDSMQRK